MSSRRWWLAAVLGLGLAAGTVSPAIAAAQPATTQPANAQQAKSCSSGAHTLSALGDQVYPETGNGGYRSVHTDVHMVYDAPSNRFLPGNNVVLADRATQCLTDFSLDFERNSADTAAGTGPDLAVSSVSVNGRPAAYRFVQPTYPGDPKGQNDPDPRAHQAGRQNPVGGPEHNPLPPACTPELAADADPNSQDGQACPATKLVITPVHPIANGANFVVRIGYTGRPGLHRDGDGSTEGWFRSDTPAGDGSFVTTEPVGTEDWMPLNDHPSAKPTYDFYDTVNVGRTAVANGLLISKTGNPPDANYPGGSTTWHWHSSSPIASYLVESSVGSFDLAVRTGSDGVRYYQVQARAISPAQKAANAAIMNQQQDIVAFQSQFNGRYPFRSAGILIGLPSASFEEEMQSMITFEGGRIDLDTLYHENNHQWWGDNVSEANYNMTFYKEGMATLGEFLFAARTAQTAAGGRTAAGRQAFEASLRSEFNRDYADPGLWSGAPSKPTADTLFDGNSTYERPGIAYVALRQILGASRFTSVLKQIQATRGGSTITEPQLEAAFRQWLPNHSPACTNRLHQFFVQWFDTSYPTAAGVTRPWLTGPELTGTGFFDRHGNCS